MNILLIAYYFPPLSSGGTVRPLKMAQYLPRLGHPVTVLTHTYIKAREMTGTEPGVVRIYDVSHNKNRRGIRRLQWLGLRLLVEGLNRTGFDLSIYTWWKRRVLKYRRRIAAALKPDVVLATYPPVETLELGLAFAEEWGLPLVADFRDGLLFEPIEQKRLRHYPPVRRLYGRLEAAVARQASAIITIAEPITDYFRQHYGVKRAFTLSSGFDPRDFRDLPPPVPLDSSTFNILFTGRFALSDRYNPVGCFFEALRGLIAQYPRLINRFRLHLLGEYRPGELAALRDLMDKGVIVHHGFVPRAVSLASQRQADLLLIITPPDRRSATSAKIFEYLYAGKPVLALTHRTVLADMIRETGSGWIVHPLHTGEIRDILYRLLTDARFYRTIQPSKKRIQKYSLEETMHLLDQILRGL
jgi:glycosyltransferase involved in cell wall biosynthesis